VFPVVVVAAVGIPVAECQVRQAVAAQVPVAATEAAGEAEVEAARFAHQEFAAECTGHVVVQQVESFSPDVPSAPAKAGGVYAAEPHLEAVALIAAPVVVVVLPSACGAAPVGPLSL